MNRVSIAQLKDAGLCPEWLAEAQTQDAVVSIDDAGVITWHVGTWEDGTWENGVWLSGTWENGIWEDGTWENGIWEDGTWERGTWKYGAWRRGIMQEGTVEGGALVYYGVCPSLHLADIVYLPGSKWGLAYHVRKRKLTIGCETRTIEEWDSFFAEDCEEVIRAPRNTTVFRSISDNYDVAKFIINKIENSRK